MSVESDLRTFLLGDATVSAAVGPRMYAQFLPQAATYPAISFQVAARVSVRDLSGPAGRARPRITVNSWGRTYQEAKLLSEAVRRRMDGFKGEMGATRVGSIALDNSFDLYEDEVEKHRVIADYILSHLED